MLTITEQYNTAVIYSETIDKNAEGLLRALCASPLSAGCQIRVMPDVHAGKGCAIGTTMKLANYVAPGLVGADIGCGITAFQVSAKRLELAKLDKMIYERIPAGRAIRTTPHPLAEQAEEYLAALHCAKHIRQDKARLSIGTLGGGNHFIEMDKSEDGELWLIVHCGSRHLGVEIATYYQEAAFKQCPGGMPYELAYAEGDLQEAYLHDMQLAQSFASLNRRAIAEELLRGMKLQVVEIIETVHNYIELDTRTLRKGAVSAQLGERLLLPLNMRDGCLICCGKGNPEWNFSAPHGAGRLVSRAEAKQSFTLSQYKKAMAEVYTTSVKRETLDESPMAYKPMADIIAQIAPTVNVLTHIRPIYNFKAGEA